MDGWIFDRLEIALLLGAGALAISAFLRPLRAYRAVLIVAAVLLLVTGLYPRPGNWLGRYLFEPSRGAIGLPIEVFGALWWVLGAWLVKSLLARMLRRTWFPNDGQPHARRLFADLATAFVYVVAFVGIMETVLKQPISAVLATSGVLAIVLGLALQNTLADVFSGLAINIERPFRSGDWITANTLAEGQVIEINWRATRMRTVANDIIVIPNSVIAKAVVTNHSRLSDPLWCSIRLSIDSGIAPSRVIDMLQSAAVGTPGMSPNTTPNTFARGFVDAAVIYETSFAVDDFEMTRVVQSALIGRMSDEMLNCGIRLGAGASDVRIVRGGEDAAGASAVRIAALTHRA